MKEVEEVHEEHDDPNFEAPDMQLGSQSISRPPQKAITMTIRCHCTSSERSTAILITLAPSNGT